MSAHLARMLKQAGQQAPATQPILEVNPQHALVQRLQSDDTRFEDLAHLLFEQAWLAEGGQLDDPAAHVRRVTRLLTTG
jgi:molecular chaperone HtpG